MTARDPIQEEQPSPVDRMLSVLYDNLSNKIAGGQRVDPRMVMPSGGQLDVGPGGKHETEGILPDEYRTEIPTNDWFNPEMFLRASQQADPRSALDLSGIPAASGPGRPGTGGDWFRGGEAPNNFVNRHNPLYTARAEFTSLVDSQIEDIFEVQGASGHYRQPHASHAAAGGPSANSDHYSAGAIDYFGTTEELQRLRDWLVEQPWVSFVRWQSESHFDHVHVSVDLGWVAENYFGGDGSLPAMNEPSQASDVQVREQEAPDLPQTVDANQIPDAEVRVL